MKNIAPANSTKKKAIRFILFFWAVSLFADFPLLAYHFKFTNLLSDRWIPLAYALAMGVDAAAGLGLGVLFDRWKRPVLVVSVLITAGFAPLVFLGGQTLVIAGVVVWGIGMGMIESVLRASSPADTFGEARLGLWLV